MGIWSSCHDIPAPAIALFVVVTFVAIFLGILWGIVALKELRNRPTSPSAEGLAATRVQGTFNSATSASRSPPPALSSCRC